MGIEPTLSAWKAEVLPLNYARALSSYQKLEFGKAFGKAWIPDTKSVSRLRPINTIQKIRIQNFGYPEWRGKDSNLRRRKPSDLQSDPFGRSGTPPQNLA
jgi:hypothetical protein